MFEISRSLMHGDVSIVLDTLGSLGPVEVIDQVPCRQRDLAIAMTYAQWSDRSSKLAPQEVCAEAPLHRLLAKSSDFLALAKTTAMLRRTGPTLARARRETSLAAWHPARRTPRGAADQAPDGPLFGSCITTRPKRRAWTSPSATPTCFRVLRVKNSHGAWCPMRKGVVNLPR